jgi:Fe-S-cluster containining protein
MNYPMMAYKTFSELKDKPFYQKLINQISKKLLKQKTPVKKAIYIHKVIDEFITKLFEDKAVQKLTTCTKGCTACCHTQVTVTSEEADLLAKRVFDGKKIDIPKLYNQSIAKNDSADWYKLSYEERSCVFLDKKGECTIYEDRPSVCRTNHVVSDPQFCETKDGNENSVRLLKTELSDIATMVFYQNSKEAGTLPYMLWKSMKEKKTNIRIKLQGPIRTEEA